MVHRYLLRCACAAQEEKDSSTEHLLKELFTTGDEAHISLAHVEMSKPYYQNHPISHW